MPTGLQGNALARVQANATAFLIDVCLIEQQVQGIGVYGEQVQGSWNTLYTNEPCRVIEISQSLRNAEIISGEQEHMADTYLLLVRTTVSLDINQRVTVNGNVFDITGLKTDTTVKVYREAFITRQR